MLYSTVMTLSLIALQCHLKQVNELADGQIHACLLMLCSLVVPHACRYFKYTRVALPIEWNAMAHKLTDDGRTPGGARPRIIHFAEHKPVLAPGHPEYRFVPEQCRNAIS